MNCLKKSRRHGNQCTGFYTFPNQSQQWENKTLNARHQYRTICKFLHFVQSLIPKSEKISNIRWGCMGGVGWHTVYPTVLCKAAQYQSSVCCPKTTVHFLDILLHSVRKLLLWGKFWGASLFLKEPLQIEEITSI